MGHLAEAVCKCLVNVCKDSFCLGPLTSRQSDCVCLLHAYRRRLGILALGSLCGAAMFIAATSGNLTNSHAQESQDARSLGQKTNACTCERAHAGAKQQASKTSSLGCTKAMHHVITRRIIAGRHLYKFNTLTRLKTELLKLSSCGL